jgi:hypothetical protein
VTLTTLDIPGLELVPSTKMKPDYGKWMIHGPQGAGKTRLLATLAELGPMLYVDLMGEKGTRSFKGAPFERNITIARPDSVTMLDDIYWKLAAGNHPFVGVGIDSITSVQKMAMRFMLGYSETAIKEIRQGTAPADIRTWGQTLDIMTDFSTFFYGLADGNREHPMHVGMTAQTVMVDNEDTGERDRCPDVQKGARSIALAAPDYILYCETEANLEAIGDDTKPPVNHVVRFGAHPGYRTKGRLPYHLQGKFPPILGRGGPTSLATLSRVLGVGGVPAIGPSVLTKEKESKS